MMMIGQNFNPTCARYLRMVDGEEVEHIGKVAPERPFDLVGQNLPYDGDWKSTLKKNLGWNYKMENGCLAIYATTGIFNVSRLHVIRTLPCRFLRFNRNFR